MRAAARLGRRLRHPRAAPRGPHAPQQARAAAYQWATRSLASAADHPQPADATKLSESFLCGESAAYLEELYLDWLENPDSVHPSWSAYFAGLSSGAPPGAAHSKPGEAPAPTASASEMTSLMDVQKMVRGYQARGHTQADLDPLGIRQADLARSVKQNLDPKHYGWTEQDMGKTFDLSSGVSSGYLGAGQVTLGDLVKQLEHTYTGKIGFEFMHVQSRQVVNWFRDRVENYPMYTMSPEQKRLILERLMDATLFEQFLEVKYANDKRFGLEGCESLIPAMKALIDTSVDLGVQNVVIGMPHRGRLNVLTQVMEKPMEAIFSEFAGANATDDGSGDVKYHLGTSVDRETRSGKTVHLSLAANPSHLETVNPVVAGKTRAVQRDHAKGSGKGASQDAVEEIGYASAMPVVRSRPISAPFMTPTNCFSLSLKLWRLRGRCCTATRRLPGRAWCTSTWGCASCRATPTAARSTSSSTTRSASPPTRASHARPPTAATSARPTTRRSSTSTVTTRRRLSSSHSWPRNGGRSTRRM